jgi:hypothetical protein
MLSDLENWFARLYDVEICQPRIHSLSDVYLWNACHLKRISFKRIPLNAYPPNTYPRRDIEVTIRKEGL